MARLSDFDPDAPPGLVAGSVTYLRPASEWAGSDARTPAPFECWYGVLVPSGAQKWCIVWNLMNEQQAAKQTPVTVVGRLGPGGLPVVREYSPGGGHIEFEVHGDWLQGWQPIPPTVAADECTCDVFTVLMVRGCVCGHLVRERNRNG